MTELDFLKLKDKVNKLACSIGDYKRIHKELHKREEREKGILFIDKYIKAKIKDKFHKRYNEIYEELFRIDERLKKLEDIIKITNKKENK